MSGWPKRTGAGAVAVTALLAAMAALPAAAADYTIKAVFLANTDDEDYGGLLVFKDFVKAQSNGAIEVEIYPGASCAAIQGSAWRRCRAHYRGVPHDLRRLRQLVPEAQVMDLPYIFPSDRVAECALANNTDFFKKLRDATLAQTGNMRLMTVGNTGGWRNFATVGKQIKAPADVSGLKLRTIGTNLQNQLVSAMGASPTPVAWPEVYNSLATGVIDGTNNGITDVVGMKFHEHLKCITLDGHAYMGALWMMNNNFYEGLDDGLKPIVQDGFDALRWTTIVLPKRRQIEAYEAFEEAGGEVYVPRAEEKAQFVEAAQPVWDWYKETYGQEWIDALQAAIGACEEQIAAQQAEQNA